ncbi:hxxPF-repeated domain protein, partial [Mycobacterium ulcerans str. Harvey]
MRPLPEPPELPGVSGANPCRRAQRRVRPLPAGLFSRVEEFARKCSASPFMVLLAAYGVLVRRYTGASDFWSRSRSPNAVVPPRCPRILRQHVAAADHDTVAGHLHLIRQRGTGNLSGRLRHQSVGIDRVVREANPERMGRDGMDLLVRLGFNMRKSAGGLALDGVVVRQLGLGAIAAHLPLSLTIALDPDDVSVEFEYQQQLSSVLVDQMLAHYLQLV